MKVVQGPWASFSEPVLAQNRIDRQAYHSGTFAGNHIHKALQQEVISAIVSAPITVHCKSWFHIQEHKRNILFLLVLVTVHARYSDLFTLYASCRSRFASCPDRAH